MKTDGLEPVLQAALERKGYSELTAVQEAVLDPAVAGKDLRITSQTGSGKTVAIGFVIGKLALTPSPSVKGIARPRVLVVAPTRELAKQVESELTWLYAEGKGKVASTTGGASYRDEHRALAGGPSVVVGTPGRLLDHLNRGSIDASEVGALVLDEADRMLDMGFREELDAIVKACPEGHLTHLVSATFPKDVQALANRAQKNPVHVEGTRLGTANVDIDHLIHIVDARQKVDAVVNLLLANPDAQTLVFTRTRAGVADVAGELSEAGFAVGALSGEMDQAARNRALASFKRGDLLVLVATDVAARGIDVQDIARVIHLETPTDGDTYTHRSGRTGRAGRRGTSSVLVTPSGLGQAVRVLRQAGVQHKIEPIPSAEEIRAAADQRLFDELTRGAGKAASEGDEHAGDDGDDGDDGERDGPSPRVLAMARRLMEANDVEEILVKLLARVRPGGGAEPRDVRRLAANAGKGRQQDAFPRRGDGPPGRFGARGERGGYESRGERGGYESRGERGERAPRGERAGRGGADGGWVPFRVSWGSEHGADARRLMAMVCRRGGVESKQIGAIHVDPRVSVIEVATDVADDFARAAGKPDPRDPRVTIHREQTAPRWEHPRGGAGSTGGAASRAGADAGPPRASAAAHQDPRAVAPRAAAPMSSGAPGKGPRRHVRPSFAGAGAGAGGSSGARRGADDAPSKPKRKRIHTRGE